MPSHPGTSITHSGFWCAACLAGLALVYLGVWTSMVLLKIGYPPPEPYQTILNAIPLLSAPIAVFFWAVLRTAAPPGKKFLSLASLSLVVIFTTLTCVNRFVAFTVVRQSLAMGNTEGLQRFSPYDWPSIMLAMEILGWGFFFGLVCLCLAPLFTSGKLERAIFWALLITGALNLASVLGPLVNRIALLGLVAPIAWG